jgi:hypothetical protein
MMGATATHTSSGATNTFGPLHQIDAGLLNVGYAEAGPAVSATTEKHPDLGNPYTLWLAAYIQPYDR